MSKQALETKTLSPLSLRKNFSWTLVGNLAHAASQWGILIVFAKLEPQGQAGEFTGIFALGIAIAMPILTLSNMNLRAVLVTDAKREYKFGHYLGLRILTTSIAIAIALALILLTGHDRKTALIIFLVCLSKSVDSITDIFHGYFQSWERMEKNAISKTIRGLVSLLAVGLVMYYTRDMLSGLLALVISKSVILLTCEIPMATLFQHDAITIKPIFKSSLLPKLLWLAFPLGLAAALYSLGSNIPRYFTEYYIGKRELGIFASLAYLMAIGGMFVDALNFSIIPRLTSYYANNNISAFKRLLLKLGLLVALFGLAGVLVAIIAGESIVSLLYNREYAEHAEILNLLMGAALFVYIGNVTGVALLAMRKFRTIFALHCLGVLFALLFSKLLIPDHGLFGTSFTVLVSAVFLVLTFLSATIIFIRGKTTDDELKT